MLHFQDFTGTHRVSRAFQFLTRLATTLACASLAVLMTNGPTGSRAHAATGPPRAHGSTGPGPASPSAEKTMAKYTLLCAREHFRKVGEMLHSRRSVSGLAGPLQSELGEPCETCQQLLLLESSLSGVFWNCTLCSRNRSSICVRHLLIACAVVRTTSRDAF